MTLDDVRKSANTAYPSDLLSGCQTGLLLFGAGFYGRNDGIHFYDAAIDATVVDSDSVKVQDMYGIYVVGDRSLERWDWIITDAFEYMRNVGIHEYWDVVSVDCPMNLIPRCYGHADQFAASANKLLTITCSAHTDPSGKRIPGWEWRGLRPRTEQSAWATWTRRD